MSIKICPNSFSYDTVGGTKEDSFAIPDSQIYRTAEEENAIYAYCAETSRTNFNAWVRLQSNAITPTLLTWGAVWAGATPTLPVLARTGTGTYTVTFPATVADEQGNLYTLNFKMAQCTCEGSTLSVAQYSLNVNSLTIYLFNPTTGSLSDFSGNAVISIAVR